MDMNQVTTQWSRYQVGIMREVINQDPNTDVAKLYAGWLADMEGVPAKDSAHDLALPEASRPNPNGKARRGGTLMTEPQSRFIASLLRDRDTTEAGDMAKLIEQHGTGELTKADASKLIEWLKGRPYAKKAETTAAPSKAAVEPLTDGMYAREENGQRVIYKVQMAVHGSGRLYAKELVQNDDGSWKFTYAPGAVRSLTLADKMTLEEAQEFGKLYGVCCACSRPLTDEKSIEAGIGPVCASKM